MSRSIPLTAWTDDPSSRLKVFVSPRTSTSVSMMPPSLVQLNHGPLRFEASFGCKSGAASTGILSTRSTTTASSTMLSTTLTSNRGRDPARTGCWHEDKNAGGQKRSEEQSVLHYVRIHWF